MNSVIFIKSYVWRYGDCHSWKVLLYAQRTGGNYTGSTEELPSLQCSITSRSLSATTSVSSGRRRTSAADPAAVFAAACHRSLICAPQAHCWQNTEVGKVHRLLEEPTTLWGVLNSPNERACMLLEQHPNACSELAGSARDQP